MDKDISKKLMRFSGIDTADWIMFDTGSDDMGRIESEIGFPCVVKPSGCGSSVGVSIVEQEKDLEAALGYAKKYESVILVEKKITGREFSVGILGGQALPVIEIIPRTGFYDYKNKYQAGLTDEPCPAELSAALTEKVQKLALAVHKALRLGGYSPR